MDEMTVFELLGIESGEAITVDNPWSDHGPREVIPLALSRNGISIRAIDCRYGDICYVSAEWTVFMSNGETLELKDFPYVAQRIEDFHSGKNKQKEAQRNIKLEDIEREFASISEVLDTIKLDNLKVAITGTLPLPRADARTLLESKGAIVVGSVNKQTSFLFMGNTGRYEITEKMKKAHSLGVKIITL
ncbi:BRCT domain-containing protein [Vibrio cholerae]|uniref:BRCT domain-containing protein n=1 Tax=Vibrio cholerae TaxID=666 RepID=UPI001FA6E70F|nr:BRCT domain-containing protein [Vibrio cholerae]MCI4613307.1 DNA ligase [Vibrio cholerae]